MKSKRVQKQPEVLTYPHLAIGLATGTVYLVKDRANYIVVDTSRDNPLGQSIGDNHPEATKLFGGSIVLSN